MANSSVSINDFIENKMISTKDYFIVRAWYDAFLRNSDPSTKAAVGDFLRYVRQNEGAAEADRLMHLYNDYKQEVLENMFDEADLKIIKDFRTRTDKCFHRIENMSASELENLVKDHIQTILDRNGVEAEIVDVVLDGSRSRGIEKYGSDLDFVVELKPLKTNEREDFLFNLLNTDPLTYDGVKVDINPIMEHQTGTLANYLSKAEKYLEKKRAEVEKTQLILSPDDYQRIKEIKTEIIRIYDKARPADNPYITDPKAEDIRKIICLEAEMRQIYDKYRSDAEKNKITLTPEEQKEIDRIESERDEEHERIAEECEREGYPAYGSNYELRCEEADKEYDEQIEAIYSKYKPFEPENEVLLHPELTEEELNFISSDTLSDITKSLLAYDEMEDLGRRFFENGYIDSREPNDKARFGAGCVKESVIFDLAHRMQDGENINEELAKTLIGNIPFWEDDDARVSFDTEITAELGDVNKKFTYDELGANILQTVRNEYEKAMEPEEKASLPELHYYREEYDLDGTADELYTQARNGYIDDPDALREVALILNQEGKTELATRVGYMEDRERELADGADFSVAQMKLDFLDDMTGGIGDHEVRDGLNLSVSYEPNTQNVLISLTEYGDDGMRLGGASVPLNEFLGFSQKDFNEYVNAVYAYNMELIEEEEHEDIMDEQEAKDREDDRDEEKHRTMVFGALEERIAAVVEKAETERKTRPAEVGHVVRNDTVR